MQREVSKRPDSALRAKSRTFSIAALSALRGLVVLSPDRLARLAETLIVRSFDRGSIICDQTQDICVLISGVAKLTCVNLEGQRILLELIGPGEIVGMAALLPQAHCQVRCEAFVDCIAGVIPATELVEGVVGASYQDFAVALQLMLGRWWQLLARYANFLDQSLERRIALTLLNLAIKIGTPKERHIVLNAALTHRDIAELVGGSRPKVTHHLADLAARGLIVRDGRRIAIAAGKLEDLLYRNSLRAAKVAADRDRYARVSRLS